MTTPPEPEATVDRTDPANARCQCGHVLTSHAEVTRHVPAMARGQRGMRTTLVRSTAREHCTEEGCPCLRPK